MEEAIEKLTNPCQPETITCESPCETSRPEYLWGVSYHITIPDGTGYAGTALVRARDARHAEQVFMTNSAFNGMKHLIKIEATAQVPDITESGLCIESYTDGVNRIMHHGS